MQQHIIYATTHTVFVQMNWLRASNWWWNLDVFVVYLWLFARNWVIWRELTQSYFVSESQRNLRRAVCLSPPLLNTALLKPVTYSRNMPRSNGTAIRCNNGSYSSVVQRSYDSDCSDWNLPSFLLVSHGRTTWICAYSSLFCGHASF